jgi:hypothetical protein
MPKLAVIALASALLLAGCGAPAQPGAGEQGNTAARLSLMEETFVRPPMTFLYF